MVEPDHEAIEAFPTTVIDMVEQHRPSRMPFFRRVKALPLAMAGDPEFLGDVHLVYQAAMHATRAAVYCLPHLDNPAFRKRKLQILVDDDGLPGGDTHHYQLTRAFRNIGAKIKIGDEEFGGPEELCEHLDSDTAHFVRLAQKLYARSLGPWCAVEVMSVDWADSSARRNTLYRGIAMYTRKRRSDRSGRPPLCSPGRPPTAGRDERLRFWGAITAGMASEEAAIEAGISPAVGTRWFREAGGIPPSRFGPSAKPISGRYLSFTEREEIALLRVRGYSIREVGRCLGRAASTISRELRRNAATRSGGLEYRATTAQWHADQAARRPKRAKLALNVALRTYVEERLAGVVVAPSGGLIPGPTVSWKGRRHGPRQDRRWANAWSPEQIARRLPVDFPDDATMRISHEAIYQALFVQGRGVLRRELTACLRTGRALRMPRARTRRRGKPFLSPEIMISQRPAAIADRAVPGHWEGDLILGLGSSAIGTLVERTTRFTLLLHLPRMAGHGHEARVKNGPALAGHGAEAVRDAITRSIITLPEELRQSLTWDQGAEMAQHARLKIDAGVQVYFCDPHSPWQRGTNENTNGLLRQYFPKGTDLSVHSAEEIAAVAATLNSRPRKTLDWKTPAETLDQLLLSANNDRVATIA